MNDFLLLTINHRRTRKRLWQRNPFKAQNNQKHTIQKKKNQNRTNRGMFQVGRTPSTKKKKSPQKTRRRKKPPNQWTQLKLAYRCYKQQQNKQHLKPQKAHVSNCQKNQKFIFRCFHKIKQNLLQEPKTKKKETNETTTRKKEFVKQQPVCGSILVIDSKIYSYQLLT